MPRQSCTSDSPRNHFYTFPVCCWTLCCSVSPTMPACVFISLYFCHTQKSAISKQFYVLTEVVLQLPEGQYSWSMKMGLETLIIKMSSNVISLAWLGGDEGHVLIRTPFSAPLTVQLWTLILLTSSSFLTFPKLPILHTKPINGTKIKQWTGSLTLVKWKKKRGEGYYHLY